MLKRLLIVAFCILFLPGLAAVSNHDGSNGHTSYPAIVFAGHNLPGGGYCDCSCSTCHDPNQTCAPSDDKLSGDQTTTSDGDYATEAVVLALALLAWLRLRA